MLPESYFHQHGILLCAVPEPAEYTESFFFFQNFSGYEAGGGTGKIPYFLHHFCAPLKTGGWEKSVGKAMAQKGCARC